MELGFYDMVRHVGDETVKCDRPEDLRRLGIDRWEAGDFARIQRILDYFWTASAVAVSASRIYLKRRSFQDGAEICHD